jgi:hypothetical protein
MPEAIVSIEADKKDDTDKYAVASQHIQSMQEQSAAGSLNFIVNPPCKSVGEFKSEREINLPSMEVPTDPASGRLSPVTSSQKTDDTDWKKYSDAYPQNVSNKVDVGAELKGNVNRDEKPVDKAMMTDADGDGLVDGIDKKTQTRAELATEKMRNMMIEKSRKNSVRTRASAGNISKVTSIISGRDAENSGMFGKEKKKGSGEFDFSATDPDNKNKVSGIGGNML